MPSTITAYYTFVPATKARASQVNTNFSNYRGDLLPINEATTTASDNAHNLGGPDHYWSTAYIAQADFRTSTTTASLILKGQTGNTTGALEFLIEGVTTAVFGASGLTNVSIEASGRTLLGVTYTANGSFTVPAGLTQIQVVCVGGGGGGGSNANNRGGHGGGGAKINNAFMFVAAGDVLSITVGTGGSAAAAGDSNSYGVDGTLSSVARGGSISVYGAPGNGAPGYTLSVYSAGVRVSWASMFQSFVTATVFYDQYWGGLIRGDTNSAGLTGMASPYHPGGAGGAGNGGGLGGAGGGGSSYGPGGAGGAATSGSATVRNGGTGGYGAGGGAGAPSTGAGGAGGPGIVIIYYTKTT